jgi:hypothetical protein
MQIELTPQQIDLAVRLLMDDLALVELRNSLLLVDTEDEPTAAERALAERLLRLLGPVLLAPVAMALKDPNLVAQALRRADIACPPWSLIKDLFQVQIHAQEKRAARAERNEWRGRLMQVQQQHFQEIKRIANGRPVQQAGDPDSGSDQVCAARDPAAPERLSAAGHAGQDAAGGRLLADPDDGGDRADSAGSRAQGGPR